MENYFGIYVIFGWWNQRKRGPMASTTHQGAPAPLACGGAHISWLGLFFGRKKDNLWKKIV